MEKNKSSQREQGQVVSSIRLNENMASYIKKKSMEIGISQNAFMIVLLDLGIKLYESEIRVNLPT